MSTLAKQLKQERTLLALDRFFYKTRFNIGLHQALSSDTFKDYRYSLFEAIKNQVLFFAKVNRINAVIGVKKATGQLSDIELIENLLPMWIGMIEMVDKEQSAQFLTYMARIGGQVAMNKLQIVGRFEIQDPAIKRMITRQVNLFYDQIDDTTKSWIARTVEGGIRDGVNNITIAKIIRDNVDDFAANRSNLIAENETANMLARVEHEFYKRNNIAQQRWITSRDERVCPICSSNEEVGKISMDLLFPSGVVIPPAHPRCRCFVLPDVVDAERIAITWTG